jgi:hypothetical protein
MDLQHIPLSDLKVAAVNLRHARKAPDVSDIPPSIRARGVLQALLVRPDANCFEIIAGRRRYFAARKEAADANVSETARTQRQIIRDCLSGEGRDKAEGWVPRYMAFPAAPYDGTRSIQAVEAWGAISQLFAIS